MAVDWGKLISDNSQKIGEIIDGFIITPQEQMEFDARMAASQAELAKAQAVMAGSAPSPNQNTYLIGALVVVGVIFAVRSMRRKKR